jgi:hypothetical protein
VFRHKIRRALTLALTNSGKKQRQGDRSLHIDGSSWKLTIWTRPWSSQRGATACVTGSRHSHSKSHNVIGYVRQSHQLGPLQSKLPAPTSSLLSGVAQ